MKKILLAFIFTVLSLSLFSQTFEVPNNYKLKEKGDYAEYEKDIIDCIDWLMLTPQNEQAGKRKSASAFLIKWVTGSPKIQMEIHPQIVNFISTSPELLLPFIGGWTKFSIQSMDYANKSAGNLAGIESVIDFYQKNILVLHSDKNVEKYIKMKKEGSLKEYIRKNS